MLYSSDRSESAVKDTMKAVRENLKKPWTLDENDTISTYHELFLVKTNRKNLFNLETGGFRSKLATFVRDYLANNTGLIINNEEEYVDYMTRLFSVLSNYIIDNGVLIS